MIAVADKQKIQILMSHVDAQAGYVDIASIITKVYERFGGKLQTAVMGQVRSGSRESSPCVLVFLKPVVNYGRGKT
jgi:hypothetical protein